MQSTAKKAALPAITLAALGVVFGDIGTSPLYALRQCFLTAHLAISEASVLGILSLIFWCMMLTVSFKYVTIIMRADNNGEGGIMSLLALNLRTTLISDNKKFYLIALGFIGASLFFGDGIITPAISVLSAIEGLSIATPIFNQWLEPLSIGIITGLFLVQRHGIIANILTEHRMLEQLRWWIDDGIVRQFRWHFFFRGFIRRAIANFFT